MEDQDQSSAQGEVMVHAVHEFVERTFRRAVTPSVCDGRVTIHTHGRQAG